jgi:hypothetical protein
MFRAGGIRTHDLSPRRPHYYSQMIEFISPSSCFEEALSCGGFGAGYKRLTVLKNPRHAISCRFGMAKIVATNAFTKISARSDVATAGLAAAQNVNVKHGDAWMKSFGPAGFEPTTS